MIWARVFDGKTNLSKVDRRVRELIPVVDTLETMQ
jgi:hypothetical protein